MRTRSAYLGALLLTFLILSASTAKKPLKVSVKNGENWGILNTADSGPLCPDSMTLDGRIGDCMVKRIPDEGCDMPSYPGLVMWGISNTVGEGLDCHFLPLKNVDVSLKCWLVDKFLERVEGTQFYRCAVVWICHWRRDRYTIIKGGRPTYDRTASQVLTACIGRRKAE